MAREGPGTEVPHRERQVVPVRSDERGPPDELVAAPFGEALGEGLLWGSPHTDGWYAHASPYPARCWYSSSAAGDSRVVASARRRASALPDSTSSASHASSPGGAPRPSHSFSRRLRWRSVRSYAVIADSFSGHIARMASSRNSRRFEGSPSTIARSSGPKNTARTCRRRSRRRRTGERFSWVRFAP